MRYAVSLLALLLLAACASPLRRGREEYFAGMHDRRHGPDAAARPHFERSEALLDRALATPRLDLHDRATALSLRVRSLIELDRHEEANQILEETRLEGFDPSGRYEGDVTGLALIAAHHLDLDRGYAQLVLAERRAGTSRARLHLAWQQVKFLRRLDTAPARAEALRICRDNAGALDFDEQRRQLEEGS